MPQANECGGTGEACEELQNQANTQELGTTGQELTTESSLTTEDRATGETAAAQVESGHRSEVSQRTVQRLSLRTLCQTLSLYPITHSLLSNL